MFFKKLTKVFTGNSHTYALLNKDLQNARQPFTCGTQKGKLRVSR